MKEIKIKQAISYIQKQLSGNSHPPYSDLNKKFNLSTYRITLNDLYPKLGIDVLNLKCKRPNASQNKIKRQLMSYVRKEVKNGHFPTRRFIEKTFGLRLTGIFKGIEDLYQQAGLNYEQQSSQLLKTLKAQQLQELVIEIIAKLNLKLIKSRGTHERGVDIIAKNKEGLIVGIEIKAHHRFEAIKKRNILPLERFLINENLTKVILITTSSKINVKNENPKIEILSYNNLQSFCNENQINVLKKIRETSIHMKTNEKEIKRKEILDYAKNRIARGKKITSNIISKDLNIDLNTYFKSIYEVYDYLKILPPIRIMREGRRSPHKGHKRNLIIQKMVNYIKKEVSRGHYPSGIDVGNQFGVKHIWNFITMKELYEKAGFEHYHIRKKRGPRKKEIQL
ncbi:hypothetical protein HOI26_03580 [Candidatus Woesearchaeota archaeon]|nr:hypothetical protein [Candidatus Woesearchaeota archaeon]